jgi:dTDP-D-glucose 4,6-dehydratase
VKPYSVFVYTRSIDLTIQGDGSSIRSFIHVEDVCLALNLIINKQDTYEIYNIGCWDEMTVLEVATLICTYYKRGQYFDKLTKLKFIPDRPFNDKRYFISNEKLQSLGWTPKITLVRKFTLRTSHIKI